MITTALVFQKVIQLHRYHNQHCFNGIEFEKQGRIPHLEKKFSERKLLVIRKDNDGYLCGSLFQHEIEDFVEV